MVSIKANTLEDAAALYRGGCLCGAVRYEAQGPARHLCVCHCTSCRRAAGAPGVPWVTFDRGKFTLTKGALTEYASSTQVLRGFCAQCGTTLTYQHAARTAEIDVTTVSLDEPESLAPRAHIWMEDCLSWAHPGDSLPKFRTFRSDGGG